MPGQAEKLRDIQSITDAALSVLDPQALLEVLVQRVKEALQADTAAVLLLEPSSRQLVATAASGLEEEVQQGVRIPVGRGFAGRIAAQGRPVVLQKVDHTKDVNPLLLDKGVRSLMGAPLLAGGRVLGVLHVGTLDPRGFTSDDVDLLQLAADRAAVAVQALTAQLDRAGTRAVQLSLLPAVGGLAMAARYVPGTGKVGGDWYDVFPLLSGELCAVIGDVTGSGLQAAVIMGRIRSTLRAYAGNRRSGRDPGPAGPQDTVFRTRRDGHRAVRDCQPVPGPGPHFLRRASAARHRHPRPARRTRLHPPDLPIGVAGRKRRPVSSLGFPPGAVLCLYTDGLVERRDRPIDEGISRLCAGDPEAGCTAVMAAMAHYNAHSDDIALLMIHRNPGPAGDSGADVPVPAQAETAQHRDVRWSGRHAIVTMPAELDTTNSSEVRELLAAVAAQSPDVITADMTVTSFCDSAGAYAIARGSELAAARGSELRLALGDSPAARIFHLIGLDQVMPVYQDVQQSLHTPPASPGKGG